MIEIFNEASVTGTIVAFEPMNNVNGMQIIINGYKLGKWNSETKSKESETVTLCLSIFGLLKDHAAGFAVGDIVTAKVSLRSREYNNRWYTNLVVDRIISQNFKADRAERVKLEKDINSGSYESSPL